ncbi:MAG TPA: CBS domain-containing protein [Steroidobacteraceae bacterium]|nr:CBS domain-containing protein [Steroidobacteraceae bacterium]
MSRHRNPQILAYMTPFPYSVDVDAPLAEAHAFLRERHIRHLPVTERGQLVGVLTDRDIKLALGPDLGSPPERELTVRDVFQPDSYVVDAGASLLTVAATMAERHLGSALVTRDGKLVGIFTTTDACRALARVLHEQFPDQGPGEAA